MRSKPADFAEREEQMMRIGMLSLVVAATLAGPVAAEPMFPFAPFLLTARQTQDGAFDARTGSDARDVIFGQSTEVRPAPRPSRVELPVRTVSASRKITRMPWTTGVFQ